MMHSNYICFLITLSLLATVKKVKAACSYPAGASASGCNITAGFSSAKATKIYTTADSVDYYCLHKQNWLVNLNSDKSPHITAEVTTSSYPTTSGTCVDTEVSSASGVTATGAVTLPAAYPTSPSQYYTFSGNGLPKYSYTMTQAKLTFLNNRPNAEYDFTCGASTATVGETYQFGQSIGYGCGDACVCISSSTYAITGDTASCPSGSNTLSNCDTMGWMPPGPPCITQQTYSNIKLVLNPLPESGSTGCYMPGGATGYFVNGIPFYAPSDTLSYNSLGKWMQTAIGFESYDIDVCYGHPQNTGQYHHHSWSPCLGSRLNDAGTGHSPLYGFAIDGFPFYGPYQASGVLATSCFKKRDYTGAGTAAGGWGCSSSTGARTCQVDSVLNPTAITALTSTYYGPSTSTTVTTQSGNDITAVSGVYYEDYYFDAACYKGFGTSADYTLDVHNGHDHGNLGYHYHLTIDSDLTPTFPYGPGPQFFGCVSSTSCKSTFGATTGSSTSTCANTGTGSGTGAWNFGKTSYTSAAGSPTLCPALSTPTMAPSIAAQTTCSVASTEVYTSASACPTSTSTTSTALIIGLSVGLGVPFLAAVGYFFYAQSTGSAVKGAIASGDKVVVTNKNVEML